MSSNQKDYAILLAVAVGLNVMGAGVFSDLENGTRAVFIMIGALSCFWALWQMSR